MNRKSVHPNLIRHCIKTTGGRPSRRMHKNIETAKIFHHLLDTLATGRGVGDVGFQKAGRGGMSLDSGEKLIRHRNGFPCNHCDVSALTCQGEGGGRPDTTGTTGN